MSKGREDLRNKLIDRELNKYMALADIVGCIVNKDLNEFKQKINLDFLKMNVLVLLTHVTNLTVVNTLIPIKSEWMGGIASHCNFKRILVPTYKGREFFISQPIQDRGNAVLNSQASEGDLMMSLHQYILYLNEIDESIVKHVLGMTALVPELPQMPGFENPFNPLTMAVNIGNIVFVNRLLQIKNKKDLGKAGQYGILGVALEALALEKDNPSLKIRTEIVKQIINHFNDHLTLPFKDASSMLEYILYKLGNKELIKYVVSKLEVLPRPPAGNYINPILLGIDTDDLEFIKLILEKPEKVSAMMLLSNTGPCITEVVLSNPKTRVEIIKAIIQAFPKTLEILIVLDNLAYYKNIELIHWIFHNKYLVKNSQLALSLFLSAIRANNIQLVKYLIEQGININVVFPESYTDRGLFNGENIRGYAVAIAISRRHKEITKMLLANGADIPVVAFDECKHIFLDNAQDVPAVLNDIFELLVDDFDSRQDIVASDSRVEELKDEPTETLRAQDLDYANSAAVDGTTIEQTVCAEPKSHNHLINKLAQIYVALSKQLKVESKEETMQAVEGLVIEALANEGDIDQFLVSRISELSETLPDIGLAVLAIAEGLGTRLQDPQGFIKELIADQKLLATYFAHVKKQKTYKDVARPQEESKWTLPDGKAINFKDVHRVQSSMSVPIFCYITDELRSLYPMIFTDDRLNKLAIIPKDSHNQDGVKIFDHSLELKILAGGDLRISGHTIYRNKDGALLLYFDQDTNHAGVFTTHSLKTGLKIVDCSTEYVSGNGISFYISSPSKIEDVETHANLFGLQILESLPSSDDVVLIDSDSDIGRTFPENVKVKFLDVQDGTPSCADNALLNALKARTLGYKVFLYKVDQHLVVGLYAQGNLDNVTSQILSAQLSDNPLMWEQYTQVMCGSKNTKLSYFVDYLSWVHNQMDIVTTALMSWSQDMVAQFINQLQIEIGLHVVSDELNDYMSEIMSRLSVLSIALGEGSDMSIPRPKKPDFPEGDIPFGGGGDSLGASGGYTIIGNNTNATMHGDNIDYISA